VGKAVRPQAPVPIPVRVARLGLAAHRLRPRTTGAAPWSATSCITATGARRAYLAVRYTDRLTEAGIEPSVGSRGDSYALAESLIGLYKTVVIQPKGPWRHLEAVEFATLHWVDWCNTRRLLEPIGYVPPGEYEARYGEARRRPTTIENGVAAEILQPTPIDDLSSWGAL
jgi:putative transposase